MFFFVFKMLLMWKSFAYQLIMKVVEFSKIMAGKIQNLLAQAARLADSSVSKLSSVTNTTRIFQTEAEAKAAFGQLREKLLRVGEWNDESSISSFALYDERGNEQPEKSAAIGDFIKITLPLSGKDDWVKITEIHNLPDEIVLTVQPSPNPTDKADETTIAHFFTDESTNNFCLQKKEAKLNFYVIGLNEKTNTEETSGVLETIRNVATSNLGCFLGIQKAQWKTFGENFLESEKSEKGKK